MNARGTLALLGLILFFRPPGALAQDPSPSALTAADLEGIWAGDMTHDGEAQPMALYLDPGDDGKIGVRFSIPVAHFDQSDMGRPPLEIQGQKVRMGPFEFTYDAAARTLRGTVPVDLVPVYPVPIVLRRVERFEMPARPPLGGDVVTPSWAYDGGSALWAGPTFADGTLYTGGQDGRVHAVEARTGKAHWTAALGGAIRTRPTVAGSFVYVQADDGYLYKLRAPDGRTVFKVKVNEMPVERLPFDNPKSRFDRFGSDVVAIGDRLYLGTHEGKVLALHAADGKRAWAFAAGGAVLAAPTVAGGRVYFGSYDKHVYALDADSGRLLWKRDVLGAVVSTPAVAGDRIVVGTRAYDLLGLEAASGEIAWKRYVWFSWVESSVTVREGVAYVGSSDAAVVLAVDGRSGARRWSADVQGWAWGQPSVTADRVYVGTSSQVGYLQAHDGGVLALDRATGVVKWRYSSAAPASGAYGFPGSTAVGEGRVFVTGLDGKMLAFPE